MAVRFEDNSIRVKAAINEATIQFLHEAGGELASQAKINSRVDTGQLKGSWDYYVDEPKAEATIGSPLENAIWEEFGTGEYAANGDGRKGGWKYVDAKGQGHFTLGKHPNRTLERAFTSMKAAIINRAEQIMKGLDR